MKDNLRMKEAFYNYIACEFDKELVKAYADKERLTVDGYRARVYYYYEHLATEEEKKMYDKAKEKCTNSYFKKARRFNKIIDHLLSLNTIEEKENYLFNRYNAKNSLRFRREINAYCKNIDQDKMKRIIELCNELDERSKIRTNDRIKIKKQEVSMKNINLYKEKIMPLIENNSFSIEQYIIDENICISTFNNQLNRIKEVSEEDYKKIINYIEKKQLEKDTETLQKIKTILLALKNGIIINNEQVPFTLLDYYLVTDEKLDNIKNILIKYNFKKENITLFTFFSRKYHSSSKIMIAEQTIYQEHRIIKIGDEQLEIDNETKEKTINFLKENNLPLLATIYGTAIKRCAVGHLENKIDIAKTSLSTDKNNVKTYKKY